MLTIGIVDDGVGVFPTLYKLKQVVSANFVGMIEHNVNFAKQQKGMLCKLSQSYVEKLTKLGCDCVVFSSIDLATAAFKYACAKTDMTLFGCEAPIMHASTYTISNVLLAGDVFCTKKANFPNVIPCCMPEFSQLAKVGNHREIVQYITGITKDYDGKFDCIALSHSSMNLYKSCFSRVFPNVQIFDSLEGVARRVRKKYKKLAKEEGEIALVDQNCKDISTAYQNFLQ